MTTGTESNLEGAVGAFSRALAQRFTRRSGLSRLGRFGVALSLGGAGVALLDDRAFAATATSCCGSCSGTCCGSESVWCYNLPGWYQNACPTGTCGCGSWVAGTCSGGTTLRYADCCGECGAGADCTCIGGAPSCCRYQTYTNGSCNDCTCGSEGFRIKCRRSFCS
jgi:hypothetical protein